MGMPQKTIKGIEDYLERQGIEIDEPMRIKLNLLGNLINDYKECRQCVREKGVLMQFNANKTQGLNPAFKAKNETIKLIIKLLGEIIPKDNKDDEDEDDTEDFIDSLIHGKVDD